MKPYETIMIVAVAVFVILFAVVGCEVQYVPENIGLAGMTNDTELVNDYDFSKIPELVYEDNAIFQLTADALRKRHYLSYAETADDVQYALVQYQIENSLFVFVDRKCVNKGKLCPKTAKSLGIAIY
jgi:hypothetical protein